MNLARAFCPRQPSTIKRMNTYEYNRQAWNAQVASGQNQWTIGVSPDEIASAKKGDWQVLLTPEKPVPHAWFGALNGSLAGKRILGLASGGGQQCPIFAAAGADVSLLDASDAQLATDRAVAQREGLHIHTVQGNMKDLSAFESASFDIVFNPVSVCFVDDVRPVWQQVARVLKPGGALLTGFTNPWFYLFDLAAFDRGELHVAHSLPHRDIDHPKLLADLQEKGEMVEFSHTFEDLVGGQLQAGLQLTHMFEDSWAEWGALQGKAKALWATRAVKVRA